VSLLFDNELLLTKTCGNSHSRQQRQPRAVALRRTAAMTVMKMINLLRLLRRLVLIVIRTLIYPCECPSQLE
jgi:hypothetical protein